MSEIKATYAASSEPLLPCPFCASYGNDVRITGAVDDFWVVCNTCGGQTDIQPTIAQAVAVWNRRNGALLDDALTMPEPEPEGITTEDVLAAELRRLNELAGCGHENRFRYAEKPGVMRCARCEVLQMHNVCAGYQDREKTLVEAIQAARSLIQPGTFGRPQNAANADYYLEHALVTIGVV